jgi:hypothetical protein
LHRLEQPSTRRAALAGGWLAFMESDGIPDAKLVAGFDQAFSFQNCSNVLKLRIDVALRKSNLT